jgi:hypothetical protein
VKEGENWAATQSSDSSARESKNLATQLSKPNVVEVEN